MSLVNQNHFFKAWSSFAQKQVLNQVLLQQLRPDLEL